MRLYYNNERQNAKVASYPISIEVKNCDDLRKAVSHDHVCAYYRGNYRKNINFLYADCSMFDVDNTHSENPAEWVDPEAIMHVIPATNRRIRVLKASSRYATSLLSGTATLSFGSMWIRR